MFEPKPALEFSASARRRDAPRLCLSAQQRRAGGVALATAILTAGPALRSPWVARGTRRPGRHCHSGRCFVSLGSQGIGLSSRAARCRRAAGGIIAGGRRASRAMFTFIITTVSYWLSAVGFHVERRSSSIMLETCSEDACSMLRAPRVASLTACLKSLFKRSTISRSTSPCVCLSIRETIENAALSRRRASSTA